MARFVRATQRLSAIERVQPNGCGETGACVPPPKEAPRQAPQEGTHKSQGPQEALEKRLFGDSRCSVFLAHPIRKARIHKNKNPRSRNYETFCCVVEAHPLEKK